MERPRYKVKTAPKSMRGLLAAFPNFHASGSVIGMKKQFYGMGSKLVRCNGYIYNVSSMPSLYDNL